MKMTCDNCGAEMVFSSAIDYGDGDVRIDYICPKCGHKEEIFK